MSEEAKLKQLIAQGKDADQWLNHPVFKHVIALRKAALLSAFESTKYKDREERDEIWRKVQALNSITSEFERMIRDARQAEKTLLERLKEKLR